MNQLPKQTKTNKIFIAADHGGFELKNEIIEFLEKNGIFVQDYGNTVYDPKDDYPDFVIPLALNLQKEPNSTKGIILCRNGVGVSMAVNKFKDIRAGLSFSAQHLQTAINDDNINVLAIPSDYLNKETVLEMVKIFVSDNFSKEERHINRLNKLKDLGN